MKEKILKTIYAGGPYDPMADVPRDPRELDASGSGKYWWIPWLVIIGIIAIPVIYQTIKERRKKK